MSNIEQEVLFLENILSGRLGKNDFSDFSDLEDFVSKEAIESLKDKLHKGKIGEIN